MAKLPAVADVIQAAKVERLKYSSKCRKYNIYECNSSSVINLSHDKLIKSS